MLSEEDILCQIPLTNYNRDKIREISKKNNISIECFLGYVVETYFQDSQTPVNDVSEV